MNSSLQNTRRSFLFATLAARSLVASAGGWAASRRWSAYPFTLGVASGYPTPDGVVFWTRLAPQLLTLNGGIEEALIAVQWEVARHAGFKSVVARGTAFAEAAWAHSVHVEVSGLAPWRWFTIAFTVVRRPAPRADCAPRPGPVRP